MFCTRCGQELPSDAKFCTACGAEVRATVGEKVTKPAASNPQKEDGTQSSGLKELFQIVVALCGLIVFGLALLFMIQGFILSLF